MKSAQNMRVAPSLLRSPCVKALCHRTGFVVFADRGTLLYTTSVRYKTLCNFVTYPVWPVRLYSIKVYRGLYWADRMFVTHVTRGSCIPSVVSDPTLLCNGL